MRPLKFLAFIGVLAILGAIAAGTYFFGGYYSVAGTAADSSLVAWTLAHIRTASIERHAKDNPPLSLNDPAIMQAGARAFSERGCVNCHGGPGVKWVKFSEGLHPDPPDLKELANERAPQQLFWVIKNGINMTGMPSFGAIEVPDQEIWTIVAFVKKLPTVSDDDFKGLDRASSKQAGGPLVTSCAANRTCRRKPLTHGTSCPSRHRRTSPKCL